MSVGKTFFVGNFDSYEIYEAFLAYKETNSIDELNILLKTLLPLIGYVARSSFTTVDPLTLDFYCTEALGRIYDLFVCRKIKAANTSTKLVNYCKIIIYNTIINYILSEERGLGKHATTIDVENLWCRLPCYVDVDSKMELNQKLNLVLSIFKQDIRYSGKKGKACCYIAECIVSGELDKIKRVKMLYRIKQIRFLTQYTEVTLRSIFNYVSTIEQSELKRLSIADGK